MRLSRHRQWDLFEEPLNPPPILNDRRQAMVEILKMLLMEALESSSELVTQIEEARDDSDRN